MGNLIYLVVTILLNTWIIAFIGYGAGAFIHVLLFFAFIVIVLRLFKDGKQLKKAKRSAYLLKV